ncbi:tyrosine recombinase XerC [Desmospora sp. 8437]|nr:tyrosine recombinase XerC [Desmospora sp. 8437]
MIFKGGWSVHPTIPNFLFDLQSDGRSPKTMKTYEGVVHQFIRWFEDTTGERFDPESVTPIDAADYKRHLLDRSKPATVNKARIALKRYFDWLVKQGVCKESPWKSIQPVKQGRQAPRWLDRKEQRALIRQVQKERNPRDIAIVFLLLHGGLRVEELCHLQLEDVKLSERKGKAVVRHGKGGKWREVPLNRDVRKALEEWLAVRSSFSPWLFVSTRKDQMTTRAVQYVVRKYGQRAGMDQCSPHTLRHTFCHELAVKGVPLDVIAALAGHMTADGRPNIATTAIYTTPGDQDLRRAVDQLSWE